MDRTLACGADDRGSIPRRGTMKIFGYGSLMCEDSLKSTVHEYTVLKEVCLQGYRRVFNLKSKGRINEETGNHSCVLNLEKDERSKICGRLYDIPEKIIDALHLREEGYEMSEVAFSDGEHGYVYIAEVKEPYKYIEGDPIQKEYLDLCLNAAKNLGEEMYENFLDSTYIEDKSLKELGVTI